MQFAELLSCPVCFEQMKPPKKIFQCSNGHALCEQCKDNPALTSCPICRIGFTGSTVSRNILAEKLALAVFPSTPAVDDEDKNKQRLEDLRSKTVVSIKKDDEECFGDYICGLLEKAENYIFQAVTLDDLESNSSDAEEFILCMFIYIQFILYPLYLLFT